MSDYDTVSAEVEHEEEIPEDHPRYQDLLTRHRIENGVEKGSPTSRGCTPKAG